MTHPTFGRSIREQECVSNHSHSVVYFSVALLLQTHPQQLLAGDLVRQDRFSHQDSGLKELRTSLRELGTMSDAHLSRRTGCEWRCARHPSPSPCEITKPGFSSAAPRFTLKTDSARACSVCFVEATPLDPAWMDLTQPEACPTALSILRHGNQSLSTTGTTQCWGKTSHNITIAGLPSHMHIQECIQLTRR